MSPGQQHEQSGIGVKGKAMALSRTSRRLIDLIGVEWPIVQAPMAGTSTPAMAAAVSNAGALGSIAVVLFATVTSLEEARRS
jgi:NAD(P)H-dependent flavin oxidoreductase YrpB (nitropropane dioxygenase family)